MAGPSPKPKFKAEEPVFSTENIRLYLDPSNAETLSQQLKKEGYVVIFRTFLTDSGLKNVLIANKQGVTEDQLIEILNKVGVILPGVILPSPSKQVVPQKTPQQAAEEEFRKAQEEAKELKPEIEEERKKVKELPKIIAKLEEEEKAKKKAEEEAKRKAEEEAKKKEPQKPEKKEEPVKPAPKKEAPQEEKPQGPSETQNLRGERLGPSKPSGLADISADDLFKRSGENLGNIKAGGGGRPEGPKGVNLKGKLGLQEQPIVRDGVTLIDRKSIITKVKYNGYPTLFASGSFTGVTEFTTKDYNPDTLDDKKKMEIKLKCQNKNTGKLEEIYIILGLNYRRINTYPGGEKKNYLTPDAVDEIINSFKENFGKDYNLDENFLKDLRNLLEKTRVLK